LALDPQALPRLDGNKGFFCMTESETEAETLERLEAALRKIATAAAKPRTAPGGEIDRPALAKSLDMIIGRLRGGLEKHNTE
jgi:hypothetical protein